MNLKQIGIITSVKKDKQGNVTGWIKSPLIGNKFFDSNSLTSEHQVTLIKKDETVFFDIKEQASSSQKDIKIENLVLFPYILRKCFHYNIDDFKFFFKNSNEKQKDQLKEKIQRFEKIAPDNIDLDKVHIFRKIAFEHQESIVPPSKPINSSLIESILSSNSSIYNQDLVNNLIEGIRTIDSTIVYDDVKILLKYSQENPSNLVLIKNRFYQKCTDEFKFKMWFEGLIDYCKTSVIKQHFEEASDDLKAEIVTRCGGDKLGYLVLQQNPTPIEIESSEPISISQKIEMAYFSGIRAKLLEELSKAKESIKVAVAWFTNDELFSMLCTKADQGVKIELIINNDFINNWVDGLPFQEFVDRDSTELYFYDHPKRMHHKFCIIDDVSLFNGSYNWTYWAEDYNDENVIYFEHNEPLISAFIQEFDKLKAVVKVVTKVTPFDRDSMPIFERRMFKEYLSKDIESKAKYAKESNVVHSDILIDWAIEFNPENQDAIAFKNSIQSNLSFSKNIKPPQDEVIDIINVPNKTTEETIKNNTINNKLNNIKNLITEKKVKVQRIVKEKAEVQRIAKEKAEALRRIEEEAETQRIAKEEAEAQRIAKEKAEAQRIAKEELKKLEIKQQLLENAKKFKLQGQQGKLRINLQWSTLDDLDLHIYDPDNNHIHYGNKSADSQGFTGTLDIDANVNNPTRSPQENIYWQKGIPVGTFKVSVNHYSKNEFDNVPFIIILFPENEEPKFYSGEVQLENTINVLTFSYEKEKKIVIKKSIPML